MGEHTDWGKLSGLAVALTASGLIPFILCGLAAVSLDDTVAPQMASALLNYGAVVLAFIGAVHWGFVLVGVPAGASAKSARIRLLLGVVPSLVGWAALLIPMVLSPEAGLALLIVGFIGTPIVEQHGCNRGLVPPAYMWLRWVITVVVVAILVTVLVLRTMRAKIVF
jgi:hypothetical protein